MKIRTDLTLNLSLFSLLPTVIITLLLYINATSFVEKNAIEHLATISEIQQARLHTLISHHRDRVKLIASRTKLRTLLQDYQNKSEAKLVTYMQRILDDAIHSVEGIEAAFIYSRQQELVLDTYINNEVIQSTAINHQQLDEPNRPLVWRNGNNHFNIQIVEPLFLQNQSIGYLLVQFEADSFLSTFTNYVGMGTTGELIVARQEDSQPLQVIHPLRFTSTTVNTPVTAFNSQKASNNSFIQKDINTTTVIPEVKDYRGHEVIAVASQIIDLPWVLIVKMDRKEIFSPVKKPFAYFFVSILVILILGATFGLFMARRISGPIEQLTHATRLSKPVKLTSQNEIGLLATAHNNMLTQQLRHQSELEHKVEERTNELNEALKAAKAADRAKSEFLSNMSHEIRTPMNAILGMIQLLTKTFLNTKQSDYVQKMESAARLLLAIINDILDFSKIEAGKLTLDLRPNNIDQLLHNVGVIAANNIGNKKLEIIFDITPDLSQKNFMIDELRLQQVLINLTSNAIKFTNTGEIVLSVKSTELKETHILFFEVRDTGIGIAPEQLEKIFDCFSQAETSTTRRFGGTGLGLTISKHLVELMGGTICVESELGKGSIFRFNISCQVAASLPLSQQQTYILPDNLKVLIVDDNVFARQALSMMVNEIGWTAETVESGEEAIFKIRNQRIDFPTYDLILVDSCMPGMDGCQACEQIKAHYESATCPLIIIVNAHRGEAQKAVKQVSTDGLLYKPVTPAMFLDSVAKAIKDKNHCYHVAPQVKKQHLEGLTLLLVEDNPTNQQVAKELLEIEGAAVELANDGVAAINIIKNNHHSFDAVLMDIQMPNMDGYSATKEIRNTLGLKKLPIIAMTASTMESDQATALAASMNDHIGKPFQLEEVINVLLKWTRAQQQKVKENQESQL
ncbi:response regulator [Spartinivicinus ruber]|uniref:response regulator n=1 Tax=Spartinivicinus ruber TaxID=2683272 RepID=UPI0013D82B7F|nr:response regulator [Spartinivicinus ruber]